LEPFVQAVNTSVLHDGHVLAADRDDGDFSPAEQAILQVISAQQLS
jgi:hypothetical protein